jgi:hypothetical protein
LKAIITLDEEGFFKTEQEKIMVKVLLKEPDWVELCIFAEKRISEIQHYICH